MATRSKSRQRTSPGSRTDIDLAALTASPVYLVTGGDEFLVARNAQKLVEHLCPEAERAFGLEVVEAAQDTVADVIAAVGTCIEAIQTLGFFGGRKVVWLRDATFLGDSRVMSSDDVKSALDKLTVLIKKGLPDGSLLVLSALKLDKRSVFFKAIKEAGRIFEFALPDKAYQLEEQARTRARQFVEEAGLRISEPLLNEFVERTGTDTRQIAQEVEKLRLYLGESREVTGADLGAIVSPSREAAGWDLADAVAHRDLPRALGTLRQLLFQNESGVRLIISLENRFRELLLLQQCVKQGFCRLPSSGRFGRPTWAEGPEAEAALAGLGRRDLRTMNPFRVGILGAQSENFSRRELLAAHQACVETHEAMVSSGLPAGLQLELLILRILGPADTA